MRITRACLLAAAIGGLSASAANAAEILITPAFSHRLTLRNPATTITGSAPTVQYRNDAEGKGAGYAANVISDDSQVFFFSSAIAAGRGNSAISTTKVNLELSNIGGQGVKGLTSTIFEATFGLYVAPFAPAVGGCTGATLPTCPGVTDGFPNFRTLRDGRTGGDPFNQGQAGAFFNFEVLLNDQVQRSIGGAIVMQDASLFGDVNNPGLGLGRPVILASSFIDGTEGEINLLKDVLPGFSLVANDPYNYIFGWGQSDFTVLFDQPIIGSGVVTYQITAGAWGDSRRLLPNLAIEPFVEERSIVAFSCFADPVGRGSTRSAFIPVPVCDDFGGFGGGNTRDYVLNLGSVSQSGILRLRSIIPEPDTWAMLIVGFGLVGLSMRRTKKPAATAA